MFNESVICFGTTSLQLVQKRCNLLVTRGRRVYGRRRQWVYAIMLGLGWRKCVVVLFVLDSGCWYIGVAKNI